MTKKIYVLGAGASRPAGIPMQSNLIKEIFSLQKADLKLKEKEASFMSETDNDVFSQFNSFNDAKKTFAKFLLNNFASKALLEKYMNEKKEKDDPKKKDKDKINWPYYFNQLQKLDISLENIFTIIDKALNDNIFFQNYNIEELRKVKNALDNTLIYLLSFYAPDNNELYKEISRYLTKELDGGNEPVIISLNWDTLIDEFLFKCCKGEDIFVDYGTDYYNISNGEKVNRNIDKKIKLLKLHGSINWLVCRNCYKLFAQSDEILALSVLMEKSNQNDCNFCEQYSRKNELENSIITPTYIKNFERLHYKNIWRMAFNEISEADEIVFIGYSFPEADYELRYLFKRATELNTEIKVVLYKYNDPDYYKKKINGENIDDIINKLSLPAKRYLSFFKQNNITFNYKGIEDYFKMKGVL